MYAYFFINSMVIVASSSGPLPLSQRCATEREAACRTGLVVFSVKPNLAM